MGFAPADNPQVLVYVVIDTPHLPPGPEQAHSTFATQVAQKILTESLPYLNIFPTVEVEDAPEELLEQLPEEDGIVSETEPETETEAPTREYATDEYIIGEEEVVEELPGSPAGVTPEETLETSAEGETSTEGETESEESSSAEAESPEETSAQ